METVKFIQKRYKSIFATAGLILLIGVGVALASSTGEAEAAEHMGWLATDTYKLINFIVLVVALVYIAKKPVQEFFSSRINSIRDELAELERKKAEAEKILAGYADKIANLDKESEKIIADYVRQGEEAKKRILAEAELQAVKLEEMAKRNIEQEFKAAKAGLLQDIAEKAIERAESFVKKSISSEDQDRLVDDYLNKVVAS